MAQVGIDNRRNASVMDICLLMEAAQGQTATGGASVAASDGETGGYRDEKGLTTRRGHSGHAEVMVGCGGSAVPNTVEAAESSCGAGGQANQEAPIIRNEGLM